MAVPGPCVPKLASLQFTVSANGVSPGACAGATHSKIGVSPLNLMDVVTGPMVPKRHPTRA